MRDKILEDVMKWIDSQDKDSELFIEEFVDKIIDKTADSLIDKITEEFKEEFEKGNLQHPFIISPEYYLYLKLKEIRQNCIGDLKEVEEKINEKKEE